jgi:trehalose 6-phosphate synthase
MRENSPPGGLATGILSAMRSSGGLWFGWNGETVPGEPGEAEINIREGITYATVEAADRFFPARSVSHFEVLRALPKYAEIVCALLAYELVGFQTETDRASFLDAVRQIYGADAERWGRPASANAATVRTGVFPIGVDVKTVGRSAARAIATGVVQRTVQGLLGRRLIIGADRLDPSKGLLERFRAYRRFFEDYPEQRGQVTYLQIAPLGRQSVRAYSQIRDALEQSSGRTNGHFADADWTRSAI